MVESEEIREGMTVHAADGRTLGTVVGIGDKHFELEPPGVLPLPRRDFLVEREDVARVEGRDIYLRPEGGRPLLTLEEDDDGSALPPRRHQGMDAEPVNAPQEPVRH